MLYRGFGGAGRNPERRRLLHDTATRRARKTGIDWIRDDPRHRRTAGPVVHVRLNAIHRRIAPAVHLQRRVRDFMHPLAVPDQDDGGLRRRRDRRPDEHLAVDWQVVADRGLARTARRAERQPSGTRHTVDHRIHAPLPDGIDHRGAVGARVAGKRSRERDVIRERAEAGLVARHSKMPAAGAGFPL